MKIYNNISYADADRLQKLDIYSPENNDAPCPVIIHIHGGAWTYGDKSNEINHGKFYCQRGVTVVCINYRLSEEEEVLTKHPTHAEDCASAVAWVYKNIEKYGGDKDNIFLSGHSSGAHLATLIATDKRYLNKHNISCKDITGVIAVDTAAFNLNSYSYIDDTANEQMQSMSKRVKDIFSHEKEQLSNASPLLYVARETCRKFLIIVSANRPLAKKVSENFVNRLKLAGKEATLLEVDINDHDEINTAMSLPNNKVATSILSFLGLDT